MNEIIWDKSWFISLSQLFFLMGWSFPRILSFISDAISFQKMSISEDFTINYWCNHFYKWCLPKLQGNSVIFREFYDLLLVQSHCQILIFWVIFHELYFLFLMQSRWQICYFQTSFKFRSFPWKLSRITDEISFTFKSLVNSPFIPLEIPWIWLSFRVEISRFPGTTIMLVIAPGPLD